ncbi:MAG: mandelate racemase/muconate lactonizing enzyme family protein [Spirochaetaceae bacterium]|nr:MAG: mandelate racemase/muconate lactonizing enzyme family protein [Spirochaetaceae bacterium]
MKITGVQTHLLTYEYKPNDVWSWAGGKTLRRNAVLVELRSDDGVSGIGEIGEAAFLPRSVSAIVAEQFEPMLVGEDPMNIEKLWHKMYMRSSHWGRKGVIIPIISGIDIALWDMVAKSYNQPLYRVLGGACRASIRAYASAGMDKPVDEMLEEIKSYQEQGYTAIKIRIGTDTAQDIERVRKIREFVGDELDIMVDASQSYTDNPWTDKQAIRIAKELEEFRLFWLEEPLHEDDVEGYRRLRNQSNIPIAAGENEYTRFGFRRLISPRAVDIVQPDVTRSGGISECKKIAAMASAHHLPCAPHSFGSGVGLMANIHFIASTANCIILEYDRTVNPLRDELLLEPIQIDKGYVRLPEAPGLGIKKIEEFGQRFPFLEQGKAVDRDEQKRGRQLTWFDI